MTTQRYRVLAIFFATVLLSKSLNGDITFSDGKFANWSTTAIIQQDDVNLLVQVFPSVVSTGGNPGIFYRFEHVYLGPNVFRTSNINNDFSFSAQTSGPIISLTFRYDIRGIQIVPAFSNGIGFEPLIKQGDSYYRGPNTIATLDTSDWTEIVLPNLTADDFQLVAGSGPPKPNFGVDGLPIDFGFTSQNGTDGNPTEPVTQIGGIDNWQVTIKTTDALLGDINLDGSVNLLDVDPFITLLSNGQFQTEADTNCDGSLNLLDVSSFVAILGGEQP